MKKRYQTSTTENTQARKFRHKGLAESNGRFFFIRNERNHRDELCSNSLSECIHLEATTEYRKTHETDNITQSRPVILNT